jgi:Amt family ammonium transporter
MHKLFFTLLFLGSLLQPGAHAAEAVSAARPEPTMDQRVADIEAYINNSARVTDGQANSKIGGSGPAHNGWMMVSAALVLFMTLPGLALFYGGLVRSKNVLSVLAQCLGLAGVVTILWWAVGYSLSFGAGGRICGGTGYAFMSGIDSTPNPNYSNWVSHNIFFIYQMMFAIITPALIVGAIAERMKFSAVMLFCVLWMFLVYFPVAHMVWGVGGMMNGLGNDGATIKAIDFAGGIVVHMTSGWSALALCLVLGKRHGHGKEPMPPHSMVLCAVGTGMLWVGWYGFNAGSAVAADGIAANAFVTTTLSAGVACCVWPGIEYLLRGKPSVLGFCSGAIAGLATITPAAGFVTPGAAIFIGIVAGAVPYFACTKLKGWLGYDDALDTFGVHAVGGTLGTIMAGAFATTTVNGNLGADRIKALVGNGLWLEQAKAAGLVLLWSVAATLLIALLVKAVLGSLRATVETETIGLDLAEHGEEGYHD